MRMSGTGFDLERSVEEAWRRFRVRLADHLAQMQDDDVLVVEVVAAVDELGDSGDGSGDGSGAGTDHGDVDGEGTTPYVQFLRLVGEPVVRAEVSGNTCLGESFALDEDAEAALTAMGWQSPTGAPEPGSFTVDVPVREVDRLAVMALRALREVFGALHPAFLDADGLETDPEAPTAHEVLDGGVPERSDDEPLALVPQSADHLRELVGTALAPLLGREPVADEDGDIPVFGSRSLVYVRVEEQAPVVQLFSFVVQDVTDRRRGRHEVNVLNKEYRFIKFTLVHDRVLARIYLPSWPFVPEHLRSMVTGMTEALDDLEDDVVDRLGGRRIGDVEDAADVGASSDGAGDGAELPTPESDDDLALQTLLQLDAGGGGTLDPELVAGICGHDQRRVLRLLRTSEEQEIAWRQARDTARESGAAGEVRACAHELRAWRGTSELLRKVLWLVVRRTVGPDPSADAPRPGPGGSGRTRQGARPARRRETGRPTGQRRVRSAADLARHFGAEELESVARALAGRSTLPVQVVDHESYLEVAVAGGAAMLAYPFSLGELYALVRSLEVAAGREQQARQGD